MSALSVIPHSPTGEQPHASHELHTLLAQLDETELAALAILVASRLSPAQCPPREALQVLQIARDAQRSAHVQLLNSLAEFNLLLLISRAMQPERSADHV